MVGAGRWRSAAAQCLRGGVKLAQLASAVAPRRSLLGVLVLGALEVPQALAVGLPRLALGVDAVECPVGWAKVGMRCLLPDRVCRAVPDAPAAARAARATPLRSVRCEAYDHGPHGSRQPVATAEFLAVDTETNGLGGERCELTEVGAVLVGGGELHERWESLSASRAPLSRGIQRFTGITQAMVDEAPPPEARAARARRAAARPRARRALRALRPGVLRQAFARAGAATGRDPPVLCTVALARRFAPLAAPRAAWPRWPTRSGSRSRSPTARCPTPRPARACSARCSPRLCAHAATVGDALALLRPARRGAARRRPTAAAQARRAPASAPDLAALPDDPGVYVFRDADGRPLYVGKSVCVRTRARAHFTPPATWTGQAEHVDYQRDGVRARRARCSRTG